MEETYYTRTFLAKVEAGSSALEAGVSTAQSYLDGKPRGTGKRRTNQADRDRAFSASPFLKELPAAAWGEDALVVSVGRLLGQDHAAIGDLLEHVATVAPASVRRAVRLSGLVLRPDAQHWREVAGLAVLLGDEFDDFSHVLDAIAVDFDRGRRRVDKLRQPFQDLSPLELLVYASLYAFKHLVATHRGVRTEENNARVEAFWYAVNDLFSWKLATADKNAFRLTEGDIAECCAAHLSPVLFPVPGDRPRTDLLAALEDLMDAEAELQEAKHTVELFCYEDAVEFVWCGDHVKCVVRDARAQHEWRNNNERLQRIQRYWYLRGMVAFADSGRATVIIGRPENHDWNRWAYVKAMATQLRLNEVYGVGETVSTETGKEAPLFEALLSRELTTAFCEKEFVMPYRDLLARTGNWVEALRALAIGGLADGMQNRLPLKFSRREDKIRNTVEWTVSSARPRGSPSQARAIVDFWTIDWRTLAGRLRRGETFAPELFERPFLKLGQYLFELPWVIAYQNNQTAAINNMRRLGARRSEARRETGRIEDRLATLFRERGFDVRLNWQPVGDAGEVDLVCRRDGGILILEVKSGYIRRSHREAWLHGTMGLRHAGLQLQRKVSAVVADPAFGSSMDSPTSVLAWIVDTSIEHDHKRFNGYLKVSLEELLIALRDDKSLLDEADKVFDTELGESTYDGLLGESPGTLYPKGFSFDHFVDVIESESVWRESERT